jgi:outer membrane protein
MDERDGVAIARQRGLKVVGTLAALDLAAAQGLVDLQTRQPPSKVGTISLQAAVVGTAEGKQASAELQTQFAARSAELQNLQKQIEDLQAKLQSGQATLSDEERGRLQRKGERLSRTFQRKQQYFQDDLNVAQHDVINNIGRKLVDVLSQYSKENGYSVILDSSQQTPVVYGAPQVDVTQDIVRLYDQSHLAKAPAATAPSKPAPPKPTPTPAP